MKNLLLLAGAVAVAMYAFGQEDEFDPKITDYLKGRYGDGTIDLDSRGNLYYSTDYTTVVITPADMDLIRKGIAPSPEVVER